MNKTKARKLKILLAQQRDAIATPVKQAAEWRTGGAWKAKAKPATHRNGKTENGSQGGIHAPAERSTYSVERQGEVVAFLTEEREKTPTESTFAGQGQTLGPCDSITYINAQPTITTR